MTITDSCGCSRTRVAEGTVYEGWMQRYCDFHNPLKNMAPKVVSG